MRKLSLMAFASFIILWGISNYLDNKHHIKYSDQILSKTDEVKGEKKPLFTRSNKAELDRIGDVFNTQNVQIDETTKESILEAKKAYTLKNDVREMEKMLEQSYADQRSSVQDIKKIQNKLIDAKNKLHVEVKNTEKWEPKFVYYMMINENYSYSDINQIQSLSENGYNAEELNYINNALKTRAFNDKLAEFKGQGEATRKIASVAKELKDDFIDNPEEDVPSVEERMIEMNYSTQQKDEMQYGRNQ